MNQGCSGTMPARSAKLINPFFLVGSERSGTTLLRLMLDHHPQICCHSEFEYAVSQIALNGAWPDLKAYYAYLRLNRVFIHDGFEIDKNLSYPELLSSFLIQRQVRSGKPVCGATVHHHFDRLLDIWPDARFIRMRRDPRDVARSTIGMGWAGNVYHGADIWIEAFKTWQRLKSRLSADRYIELLYEDLVADSRKELRRICAFLGETFSEKMYTYPEDSPYELPDSSLATQWKRKLSEREIRLVEHRLGSMLTEDGYAGSALPPLEPGQFLRHCLAMQNYAGKARYGFRRYGAWLMVQGFVARRLGIRKTLERVRQRRNAIDLALNRRDKHP
jgi:hypothetical protein